MRSLRSLSGRHLLPIAALVVAAPILPAAFTSSVGASADTARAELDGLEVDGSPVVARHVSSDMVVDWLEEPPADALAWLDEPEAPADHRTAHEDHGHDDGHDGLDGATFHAEAATASGGSAGEATPGNGFALFSDTARLLPTGYTLRLAGPDGRIEQYRAEFAAAAQAASAATGLPIRLVSGRAESVTPGRGEITIIIGDGPCGATALGCGGPALTATSLVAGRVWLRPAALDMTGVERSNLAAHELGHALGLRHYSPNWSDGRQVMYPSISGTPTYRSGDGAGLKLIAGGYDRPAGSIARHAYAAGRLRVVGHVVSGSRVRVTVGEQSADVTAHGGRFFAEVPAPGGRLRLCATSLDAAPGFRRHLGCTEVDAPGTPFGSFERARGSFESIQVEGWAADPQTADPVRVEVRRNGTVVTTVVADGERPDIAAAHRHYGAGHGFRVDVPAVAGSNEVCVRILGVGAGGNEDLGCRTVIHAVDPIGASQVASSSGQGVTVTGWALDPNSPDPVEVVVTVDGAVPAVPGRFRADEERSDVARAHPAHGSAHGFTEHIPLAPGEHRLCLTVVNVGLGSDRSLGCHRVRIDSPSVGGVVETLTTAAVSALDAAPSVGAAVDEVVQVVGLGRP